MQFKIKFKTIFKNVTEDDKTVKELFGLMIELKQNHFIPETRELMKKTLERNQGFLWGNSCGPTELKIM